MRVGPDLPCQEWTVVGPGDESLGDACNTRIIARKDGLHHLRATNTLPVTANVGLEVGLFTDQQATLTPGVQASRIVIVLGQAVDFGLDVPAGQRLYLGLGGGWIGRWTIRDPSGAVRGVVHSSRLTEYVDVPASPTAGRWTLSVVRDAETQRTWQAFVTAWLPTDDAGAITPGTPTPVELQPGEVLRRTFHAVSGQRVYLRLADLVRRNGFRPDTALVTLVAPSGRVVEIGRFFVSAEMRDFYEGVVRETGEWTLVVDLGSDLSITADATLGLASDVTEPAVVGASRVFVRAPGQVKRLTFQGTAGQDLLYQVSNPAFRLPGGTLNPGAGTLTLRAPDGRTQQLLFWRFASGGAGAATLDATGTWTILVDPAEDRVGGFDGFLSLS